MFTLSRNFSLNDRVNSIKALRRTHAALVSGKEQAPSNGALITLLGMIFRGVCEQRACTVRRGWVMQK